jgi:hypothetical protein
LNPGNTKFAIREMLFHMDDDGGYHIVSSFDDDVLTNHDAEGDTDPDISLSEKGTSITPYCINRWC